MEAVQDPPQTIQTIDGASLRLDDARKHCKRMFIAGCALLPWYWVVNLWLFWPYLRSPRADPVLAKYLRYSSYGLTCSTTILLAWILLYQVGGRRLLGDAFDSLNVTRLDLGEVL